MGIEIRLTDRHVPISPIVIDFLYRFLNKKPIDSGWYRQKSEKMSNEPERILATAQANAQEVFSNPIAMQTINRSYDLLLSIMFGDMEKLRALQNRNKFIVVAGIPRSGGSYLTKHLFQALGMDVKTIPRVIAHDGFPDPRPFDIEPQYNQYTTLMRHMAEYLAMAELFFAGSTGVDGRVIVPKKANKVAYYGAFFHRILGPDTEVIVTLRHPISCCISTYEKSGGLPKNSKFEVRSNIESFMQFDLLWSGVPERELREMNYFQAYLLYWERYHLQLALTGLTANTNLRVVTYGENRMQALAGEYYERFGAKPTIDRFQVTSKIHKHPEWMEFANETIQRVAMVWNSVGLDFPMGDVAEAL